MSADKSGLHILKGSTESTAVQILSSYKKLHIKRETPTYEQWKRLHDSLGFLSESIISAQFFAYIMEHAQDGTDIQVNDDGAYLSIYDNLSIDAIEKDAINLSRICNCELLYISCFEGQLFRIGICQHGEKLTEYLDDREGSCVISVLNNNQMNYFFRFPVSLLQWSSLKGNQICSVLQSIMQKELF